MTKRRATRDAAEVRQPEVRPAGLRAPEPPPLPVIAPPLARAIAWRPATHGGLAGLAAEMPHDAIFVTQAALREVSRHIWTNPEQDALGFLLGDRFASPGSGRHFVVVTSTTRHSYLLAEDGTEQIPEDAWHAAHLEARRRQLVVVGWFRSAPFLGDRPSGGDVLAHRRFFTEPWHIGLVSAPRAERPVGGVYRPIGEIGGAFLPFYEIPDDDSLLPDGGKRTVVAWENYIPDVPPVRTVNVAVPRPRIATGGSIPILIPKGRPEDEREGRRRPKPSLRMSARKRRQRRRRIMIVTGTMASLAAAILAVLLMR